MRKVIPVVILCCVLVGIVTVVGMNYNKPVAEASNDLTEQEEVLTLSENELTETEKEDIYNDTMEEKVEEVLSDVEGIKSVALEQQGDTIIAKLNVDASFDSKIQDDITDLIKTYYSDMQIQLDILED